MANPDPEFIAFLKSYPGYPTTHTLDELRASDYARLDLGGTSTWITPAAVYTPTRNCAA